MEDCSFGVLIHKILKPERNRKSLSRMIRKMANKSCILQYHSSAGVWVTCSSLHPRAGGGATRSSIRGHKVTHDTIPGGYCYGSSTCRAWQIQEGIKQIPQGLSSRTLPNRASGRVWGMHIPYLLVGIVIQRAANGFASSD